MAPSRKDDAVRIIADELAPDHAVADPSELGKVTDEVRGAIQNGQKNGLRVGHSPFVSTGTSMLRTTHDGQKDRQPVKIRAISLIKMDEIRNRVLGSAPKPPRKGRTNPDNPLESEYYDDEQDPKYQAAMRQLNRDLQTLITLWGLAEDLYNEVGDLVWKGSSDDESDRGDEDAGMKTLLALGFSSHHFDQLRDDIDRLTLSKSQLVEIERQKKYLLR